MFVMRILWTLIVGAVATACFGADLAIVKDGKSDYTIVTRKNCSECEAFAALELQRYIKEMTDVEIPIASGQTPARAIIIMDLSRDAGASGVTIPKGVAADGFSIGRQQERLELIGFNARGTISAVY